jgi:sulfatase maturation enzyme AslB (radical SAM superfamily)
MQPVQMTKTRSQLLGVLPKYDQAMSATDATGYTTVKPVSWDYRFSNLCNFKCRMCGPELSSTWELELNGKVSKRFNSGLQIFKKVKDLFGNVEEITFAGGEPLIMDEHYYTLVELIKLGISKKIRISYNTNFSIIKYENTDIFNLWSEFNNLIVNISIDGTFARGELIRKGFNWNNFVKNVEQFNEKLLLPSQRQLEFSCTVQALNCFNVMELHKKLYEMSLMKNLDDFSLNFLQTPIEMSLWILDEETKRDLIKQIQNHIDNFIIPNGGVSIKILFENMIKFINMHQKQELIPKFTHQIEKLDLMRNENTPKTFPELNRIWNWK